MQRFFYISAVVIFFFFEQQTNACTAFCLKKGDEYYLAKNLDWATGYGYIFLNEQEVEKSLLNGGSLSWKSKYRSITFNQFGKEFPLGGMNEKGLVIEELNATPVPLIPDSAKHLINEFQLVQYLLDNCKSVEETIEQLGRFQCKPLFQMLHYIIADRSGKVIMVEFNGLFFNVFPSAKTGYPVLSNNNYSESLRYLTKFQGFGGNLPVKHRQGSNERFVSVAHLLKEYNHQPPVPYAFYILDEVKQTDTKWSIVYDIKELKVTFKFHACEKVKIFDFKDLLKHKTVASLGGDLKNCNLTGNNGLYPVAPAENSRLLQTVFSSLQEEINPEANQKLLYQMILQGNRSLNVKD